MFSFKRPAEGTKPVLPGEKQDDNAPIEVDPRFLVKAVAAVIVAGLICVWLTLALLFYQGQWQMVLHPAPMQKIPAGWLQHEDVRFFPSASGQPQLYGWWIPAATDSPYSADVLLYLPDGGGSLSNRLQALERLHDLGRNVFTLDYRGFGNSAKMHPSQQSLGEDAAAAVDYLVNTRHIPAGKIALYGNGTGGYAAAYAATQNAGLCCLVLDNVRPDLRAIFAADARTRILPLGLLLKNDFNIIPLVRQAQQPKLIMASSGTKTDGGYAQQVADAASGKKQFIELYSNAPEAKADVATRSFLDTYLKP